MKPSPKKGKPKFSVNRKLILILILSLVFVGLVFLVFQLFSKKQTFFSKNQNEDLENATVLELLESDLDGDGVYDWEEALWGTDKYNVATFEGVPDKEYVNNKKKDLSNEPSLENQQETATDKFAREFFSSYVALKSNEADSTTINNFASSIGQRMSNPELKDKYSQEDIILSEAYSIQAEIDYYQEVQVIYEEYRDIGMGEELDIVNQGLLSYTSSGEESDFPELLVMANNYKEFAERTIAVSVPARLADNHLIVVNTAHNVGLAIEDMRKVVTDPVVGLAGLSQYQKYSQEFIDAAIELEAMVFD